MFKTTTLILLMIKIACIISQNCFTRVYNAARTGGSSLPPNEIISNHTVNSSFVQVECLELCQKAPKCIGFNYRDAINVVNCQLTNISRKRNHTAMTEEWTLMLDDEAAKNMEQWRNDNSATGSSCADLYNKGVRTDGIYTINPDNQGSFQVSCDMSTDGGGWTVFQRRQDGSQNFYLGWSDYKAGFGDLNGEFWLGLDKIHRLWKSGRNVLRIDLMDFNGAKRYAKYGTFSVADESDKYRLNIGSFSGNAGNSLVYHDNMKFSTKDSDSDKSSGNCATTYKGAWWYNNCHHSNLNGLYLGAGQTGSSGIRWNQWKQNSMKKTEMKIHSNQF